MTYKIGDVVRIKPIEWYNENKNAFGDIPPLSSLTFTKDMSNYCNRFCKIDNVLNVPNNDNIYQINIDKHMYYWDDTMLTDIPDIETEKEYSIGTILRCKNKILYCQSSKVDLCSGCALYTYGCKLYQSDDIYYCTKYNRIDRTPIVFKTIKKGFINYL